MKRAGSREAWQILLLLVAPAVALAQPGSRTDEMPVRPPAFQMLRFDENYFYLSNPSNRTDFFDPIKYIPLRTGDPTWYLTFGGELRWRFEGNYDQNFGIDGLGPNSYWLQRITLLTDWHLGERVRFFVEGISGLIEGETQPPPPPPVQDDPLDLQFAFLEVAPYLTDDASLRLRAGRFGMNFGAGRLVATRAAANIPNRFDGFELLYSRPQWYATAFLSRPVEDKGGISAGSPDTDFWGLYVTHWFDNAHKQGLDLYYLGIHNEEATYAAGTAPETRHSLGAREFGGWHHFDWDGEQVLQVGSFGDESILAWTAGLNSGYTWDATWQPRLGLKVGITSGDSNPDSSRLGTFDALFFKSGYFNDAALIRPQNIIGLHPNLTVTPTPKVSVDGGADWFWRYSRNDAVYGVPGFIEIPANPNAPYYVATALDINLTWNIQRHIVFQASYVRYLTGTYVHEAGGSDVNYVSTTLSFLF